MKKDDDTILKLSPMIASTVTASVSAVLVALV